MATRLGSEGITVRATRLARARIVLGAALMAASVTFAVGWPGETQADGLVATVEQEQAASDAEFTGSAQLGSLTADTRIVPDGKRAGRFALELRLRNSTGEGTECAEVEACLERTTYSPMDRGAPPPTVVWKTKDTTCVPAGETLSKRIAIPAGFAARIAQASKPPRTNRSGMPVGPVVAFASNILEMHPASASGSPGAKPTGAAATSTAAVAAAAEPEPRVLSLPARRDSKLAARSSVLPPAGPKPTSVELGW